MNLTVEAIGKVANTCDELSSLDIVASNESLNAELHMIQKNLQGCMSVVSDLTTCYKTLKDLGYSQEWFDIINEGNKFITLTNLEMPKFFGGPEAKQAACEGAILETIKIWAKKVWGWLCTIWSWIMKAVRAYNDVFTADRFKKDGIIIATLEKTCDNARENIDKFAKTVAPCKIFDAKTLFVWTSTLRMVMAELASFDIQKLVSSANNQTGDINKDVDQWMQNALQAHNITTDLTKFGLKADRTKGLVFADPSWIEPVDFDVTNDQDAKDQMNNMKGVVNEMKELIVQTKTLTNHLEFAQKFIGDVLRNIASGANTVDDPFEMQKQMERVQRYYLIMTQIIQRRHQLGGLYHGNIAALRAKYPTSQWK